MGAFDDGALRGDGEGRAPMTPTTDRAEWRYMFEERAAILEHEAGYTVEEAEEAAREQVTELYKQQKERER